MDFSSPDFVLLLTGSIAAYYVTPHRWRWLLLLLVSYYFYASLKLEWLALLCTSTLIDYWAGLRMASFTERRARRPYLWASLVINLGLLFCFKYAVFANETASSLFKLANIHYPVPTFELLLPIGISFYTFQTLSYSIDVYRGHCAAEPHLGRFALFVAFFPQLLCGPIERARNLLPQLTQSRRFTANHLRYGMIFLFWGLFLKMVIADRLAVYVDHVYGELETQNGTNIILASYLFAYQLFCDFSGYSLIALGMARLLGIKLSVNFNRPFAARTVGDFWRRWHMTLTRWIHDYCFQPLSRRARTRAQIISALVVVSIVFGLWHGADWNFIVYGLYVGVTLSIGHLTRQMRQRWWQRYLNNFHASHIHHGMQIVFVFHVYLLGCILFRVDTLTDVGVIIDRVMVTTWTPHMLRLPGFTLWDWVVVLPAIGIMEWTQWRFSDLRAVRRFRRFTVLARYCVYYCLMLAVIVMAKHQTAPFIYFKF